VPNRTPNATHNVWANHASPQFADRLRIKSMPHGIIVVNDRPVQRI
jgi:hypothetical protein